MSNDSGCDALALALFAQLPGATFTKQELDTFRQSGLETYVHSRNAILRLWKANHCRFISFDDCLKPEWRPVGVAPASVANVFNFLQRNGYINWGRPQGMETFYIPAHLRHTEGAGVSAEVVSAYTHKVLAYANMEEMTSRMSRSAVEDILGLEAGAIKANPAFKEAVNAAADAALHLNGRVMPDWVVATMPAAVGKHYIVVGAGPAGLSAAVHLQRQGARVTCLEARDRTGGRVHTAEAPFSGPVDLGAQLCTGMVADAEKGVGPDPSAILCAQLGIELKDVSANLPLFDGTTGEEYTKEMDERAFNFFNAMLDNVMSTANPEDLSAEALNQSLGEAMHAEFRRRLASSGDSCGSGAALLRDGDTEEGSAFRRAVFWHWQHLEYGCSADLDWLSLPHWNQDERFGAYGGPHAMVMGGYGRVTDALAAELTDIRLGCAVTRIAYGPAGVRVHVGGGCEAIEGDAVVVTAPVGVLKAGAIEFEPPLPVWKQSAIARVGMGKLNKVFLEFEAAFWEGRLPAGTGQWGVTLGESACERGMGSNIWNFQPYADAPILCALVTGSSAAAMEAMPDDAVVSHVLAVLRRVFGGAMSPLRHSAVTRWAEEEFSRGSYSYVGIGGSGDDYDMLARPIGTTVLFAGEHTSKEHLDTVGGALRTGLREASRLVTFAMAAGRGDAECVRLAHLACNESFQESSGVAVPLASGPSAPASPQSTDGHPVARRVALAPASRKRGPAPPATVASRSDEPSPRGRRTSAGASGSDSESPRAKRPRRAASELASYLRDADVDAELRRSAESMARFREALKSAAGGDAADALALMAEASSDPGEIRRLIDGLRVSHPDICTAIGRSQAFGQAFAKWIEALKRQQDTRSENVLSLLIGTLGRLVSPRCMYGTSLPAALLAIRQHRSGAVRTSVQSLLDTMNIAVPKAPPQPASTRAPPAAAHLGQRVKPELEQPLDFTDETWLNSLPEHLREDMRGNAEKIRELGAKAEALLAKRKAELPLDALSQREAAQPRVASPRGADGRAALAGGGRDSDGSEAARVRAFRHAVLIEVKGHLQGHLKRREISREAFKVIAEKASDKVVHSKAQAPSSLSDREKGKIQRLVAEYVARHSRLKE